jgi:hypothetical protein
VSNYEIWRPITNFLWIGPGGFPLLFDTFCLFQTSSALEKDHFGDSAAYVWMCTVIASLLLVSVELSYSHAVSLSSFLALTLSRS